MSLEDSDILKIKLGVSQNFEQFLEKSKTLVEGISWEIYSRTILRDLGISDMSSFLAVFRGV